MSKDLKAMILAAGLGTRFRPHTNILPKPCLPFLDRSLLRYAVDLVTRLPASKVVVNSHHLPEKIDTEIQKIDSEWSYPDRRKPEFKVVFEKEILGNAGGCKDAEIHLAGSHIIAVNSDTVVIPDDEDFLTKAFEFHKNEEAICTMLLMKHPEAGKKYNAVWCDDEMNIRGFGRQNPLPSKNLSPFHFYGVRFFSPQMLSKIPSGVPSDLVKEVLVDCLERGERIKGYHCQVDYYDSGDLPGYLRDCQSFLKKLPSPQYRNFFKDLFNDRDLEAEDWRVGENFSGPTHLKESPLFFAGSDVSISDDFSCEGLCILGNSAKMPPNSKVTNSVIGSNLLFAENQIFRNNLYLD